MHPKERLLLDWLTEILPPVQQYCPTLSNLSPNSIKLLRYLNTADLLRPSAMVHHETCSKKNGELPSDSFHIKRVLKRDANFRSFLQNVDRIIGHVFPHAKCTNIEFLAGDSHNGGRRPVKISLENEKYVLKFAEPRAYQVLFQVTNFISEEMKFSFGMPPIIAHDFYEGWYIIPYIEEQLSCEREEEDINLFMYKLGALTALALALGVVDAHIENIIIWKDSPIIIDPECILYLMSEMPQDDRLLSTGLLSHNIHISALRGGGVPMRFMGQVLDSEGILRYFHPATGLRNRLNIEGIGIVDPANYKESIIQGFTALYWFFKEKSNEITEVILPYISNDFRIRFLTRKTKHYLAVMEMINLPQSHTESHLKFIRDKFSESGAFCEVCPELLAVEWADMLEGDVPYFWIRADDTSIYHHTGLVKEFKLEYKVIDKIKTLFSCMDQNDFELQLGILNKFLDVDINESISDLNEFNNNENRFTVSNTDNL